MLSLALVLGVGVWGYKMLARDVSGVPVIRAVEGDMRIRPQEPGGVPAPNQGLSVNHVAGEGSAPLPDRVILAPSAATLRAEDLPMGSLPERPAVSKSAAKVATAPAAETATETKESTGTVAEETDGGDTTVTRVAMEKLAAQLALGVAPLSDTTPDEEETTAGAELGDVETPAESTASLDGLSRSLRPKMRPAGLSALRPAAVTAQALPSGGNSAIENAVAAAVATSAAPASIDVDPATLPVGTRLAQLGAFDSVAAAKKEWDRLDTIFADFLEGKGRVVEEAASGGRTFYRLRATGFADLSDARRFCAAFVAQQTECIPVVSR
ncbi:SPOR domain-containing protein [Oceanicola sp. 22II-s10i]|uniref:SPOR domain-containing protein n=1 Tax=Oceanicola sp. 22II-s10i TaxID=1317116 RepID=UPI0015958824|nr:SPOR domain-containing protein [Oceanicola sp. 22II-s10i]